MIQTCAYPSCKFYPCDLYGYCEDYFYKEIDNKKELQNGTLL